jgi:hypothetical protein
MAEKLSNFNVFSALGFIPDDKSGIGQPLQQGVGVAFEVGQADGLDPRWPVFQPPFAIGGAPQALEQQHRHRAERCQLFIEKELRFENSRAHQLAPSPILTTSASVVNSPDPQPSPDKSASGAPATSGLLDRSIDRRRDCLHPDFWLPHGPVMT